MTISTTGIVVGVTGPGENTSALRWAAAEAAATHRQVTLVHALDPGMLRHPSPTVVEEELLPVAEAMMRELVAEYASTSGGGTCDVVVRQGNAAEVLTEAGRDAHVVVLSHRHLPAVRRIVTSSTAIGVAARSGCPVVAVPPDWSGEGDSDGGAPTRPVTVGVHDDGGPLTVLEAGFEAAAARGTGVRLVHAWRTDPQYDDIIVRRIDPDWARSVEREILDSVRPLARKYPDVPVAVTVRHEWPADALAVLSLSSLLLVVGRHARPPLLTHSIGSTARTVLRTSRCPVMVVPT